MKSLLLLALITTLVTGCNDSANGVPTGSTAVPLNASEKIAGQAVQATAPTDQDVLTFDQTQGIWVTKKIEVAQVNDLQNNLDAKANSVDVQSQELAINQNVALKANSVDVATGLSQKVDATDYATNNTAVQAAIDTKANTSDVNTALATKVDATAYTANNTAVANTIATNQTSTTTALATKVDATAYATNNAAVAASISNNQTSTNNALSAKLDKDGGTLTGDLQLANKDAPTETTAVQAYAVADKGKTWFNTVLNALKFWDGNTTKTVSTTDDISASEAVTNQAIATKADSASLGALAEKSTVADSDIISVSGSKVSGDIASNSAGFNGNLVGDVSGTQGNTVVDKIKGYAVIATAPIANTVLKFVSGVWTSASVDFSELTGVVVDSQIVGVSGSKVSGNISGSAGSITGTVNNSQVNGLGSLALKSSVADSDIVAVSGSKVTGQVPLAAVPDLSGTYATNTALAGKVSKTGDSITGNLGITGNLSVTGTVALAANSVPTNTINNAATERFVETSGSNTITGPLKTTSQITFHTYQNQTATSNATLDWNNGQMQAITLTTCGTFTFANMVDGGSYTLAVSVTTGDTCVFTTDSSSDNLADTAFKTSTDKNTTSSKTSVFTFLRMGMFVYLTNVGPF